MEKQEQPGEKSSRAIQYVAAVTASLATFCTGIVFAWPSQISDELLDGVLGFPISIDELGWICAFSPIGSAVLTLFVGPMCDFIGRKTTMLLLVIVFEIGWNLIVFSNSVWMLIVGRFFTGMVGGAYCATVSMYISEVVDKEVRGTLGSLTQFMICCGILYANLAGAFLQIRFFFVSCAVMPIVFLICFCFMPETPVYLLLKGKIESAKAALKRLTGKEDVSKEFEEVKKRTESGATQTSLWNLLKKKSVRKGLMIGTGLAVLRVFSGVDAITSYLTHIFSQSKSPIRAEFASIIFTVTQLFGMIPQIILVDIAGRKVLLIISAVFVSVCLLCVTISVALSFTAVLGIISVAALILYTIAFSIGIGPVTWIVNAEIFEEHMIGRGVSFSTFMIWILAFVSIKMFTVLEEACGMYLPFLIYSAISFAGAFFVWFCIPETKNKSSEEIEQMLS